MKQKDCLFCNIPNERIISENDHAYAIRDGFPVTEFHTSELMLDNLERKKP
jgi:ATP adenylyltransferase